MPKENLPIEAQLMASLSLVASICSIIGGIAVFRDYPVLALVLAVSSLTLLGLWWLGKRRSIATRWLGWESFGYPRASYVTEHEERLLTEMAKAAFLLLAFERTETGCWGKSYLFRRVLDGWGIPYVKGSLTGSPFSAIALASLVAEGPEIVSDWLGPPLRQTLSGALLDDGSFLRGREIGQMGAVIRCEPPRHAAGGCCLFLLLRNDAGPRLRRALIRVIDEPIEKMAWDKAVTAWSMVVAQHSKRLPYLLRQRAKRKHRTCLLEMDALARQSSPGQIWADSYFPGFDKDLDSNNQWTSLVALSSSLRVPWSCRHLVRNIADHMVEFLLAQGHILAQRASEASQDEQGDKQTSCHAFSLVTSVLAWRTLECFASKHRDEMATLACREGRTSLDRLLPILTQILESPSLSNDETPMAVEGYFGWAGVCAAMASLGVRIPAHDARKCLMLVDEWSSFERSDLSQQELLERCIGSLTQSGIVEYNLVAATARAATRISGYHRVVLAKEVENSAF